jgi:hypothetical protein
MWWMLSYFFVAIIVCVFTAWLADDDGINENLIIGMTGLFWPFISIILIIAGLGIISRLIVKKAKEKGR